MGMARGTGRALQQQQRRAMNEKRNERRAYAMKGLCEAVERAKQKTKEKNKLGGVVKECVP